MKQWIEFPLEDGGTLVVEVEAPEGAGMVQATRGAEMVQKARQTFEAALARLRPAAQAIIRQLRTLHDPPDEIEVEFGLKMHAETGIVVAAASAAANYKVRLKWKRARGQA